jgi:hypothetical protein
VLEGEPGRVQRGRPRVDEDGRASRAERFRHVDELRRADEHALGEAAPRPEHSGDRAELGAEAFVARAARATTSATIEERDRDAPSEPFACRLPGGDDRADRLVPEDERQLGPVRAAVEDVQVGTADPTGLDRHDHLICGAELRVRHVGHVERSRGELSYESRLQAGPRSRTKRA